MDAFGTHTGRRLAPVDVREPNPELPDGEVDLLVYVTATVQVTVVTPYDAAELATIAEHELGWNARFVSVDRVEVDPVGGPSAAARPAAEATRRRPWSRRRV